MDKGNDSITEDDEDVSQDNSSDVYSVIMAINNNNLEDVWIDAHPCYT